MDLRAKITEAVRDRMDRYPYTARTITDAVMGEVEGEITHWRTEAADAKRVMDRRGEYAKELKAKLVAVRELHSLHEKDRDAIDPWCYECNVTYPCPTLKALDGGQ